MHKTLDCFPSSRAVFLFLWIPMSDGHASASGLPARYRTANTPQEPKKIVLPGIVQGLRELEETGESCVQTPI